MHYIIVGIVLLVAVAIGVYGYFATKNEIATENEKQKFVEAKEIVRRVRERLNTSSPTYDEWGDIESACEYSSGTGLGGGGWTCLTRTNLHLHNDQTEMTSQYINGAFDKFIASGAHKILNIHRPEENVIAGDIYEVNITTAGERISCKLSFKPFDNVGLLECYGGATQSWYPNSENPHKSVPGRDAWKQLE